LGKRLIAAVLPPYIFDPASANVRRVRPQIENYHPMSDRPAVTASTARRTRLTCAVALTIAANAVLLACAAGAQTAADLSLRSLAATCAGCHGTAGHAVQGGGIPSLAGMPREAFMADMRGFRDGTRPATIMQQLAKGFDAAQIEALADYFFARGNEPAARPAGAAQ
jgi:cytochrome c553